MLRFVLVVGSVAGIAAAVGASAESARWSALLLHAEPLLLTAGCVGVYLLALRRHRAVALGLAVGLALGFVLVRLPLRDGVGFAAGPSWARQVQACATAIAPPTASVDLLQWTLPPGEPADGVTRAVELIQPDVLVLFDLADPTPLDTLVGSLGGEARFHEGVGGAPGVGVFTRGEFSMCDHEDGWTEELQAPGGYAFVFVGLGRGATFPLVVTRFPTPLEHGDWSGRIAGAADRLGGLLDAVASPEMVVVADAPVTSTYRHLFGRLHGLGLRVVPSPPNWPAHLGGVPLLPVHAYDRAWTGSAWSTVTSRRVAVSQGTRAPIWTRLEPAHATAGVRGESTGGAIARITTAR